MMRVTFCISVCAIVFSERIRLLNVEVISNELIYYFFFFQAEDGIRDLVRSRGLGDVYKRQMQQAGAVGPNVTVASGGEGGAEGNFTIKIELPELSLIHI